jgi:rsbT antagonist protein RsbS
MEVPILKQGPYLIATIQTALHDADLVQLRDAIVEKVGKSRSKGVIVDVTALDVIDSFSTRTLSDIAHMIRLRGAHTVIVGIQPEVAFAMVQLGLMLEDVPTALDLEEGLEFLNQREHQRERSDPRRR